MKVIFSKWWKNSSKSFSIIKKVDVDQSEEDSTMEDILKTCKELIEARKELNEAYEDYNYHYVKNEDKTHTIAHTTAFRLASIDLKSFKIKDLSNKLDEQIRKSLSEKYGFQLSQEDMQELKGVINLWLRGGW